MATAATPQQQQQPPRGLESRKRPAPAAQAGPLDGLPYQRKLSFKRRAHASFEDKIQSLLNSCAPGSAGGPASGSQGGSSASAAGGPPASQPPQLPAVAVALGRVLGNWTERDIVLPVATEALLEGSGHDFKASLPRERFGALVARLEAERGSWEKAAGAARRWADISVTEREVLVPTAAPKAEATAYCPGGIFHYQLRVRLPSAEEEAPPAEGRPVREVAYRFVKDASPDGMWWSVALRGDPDKDPEALTAELSVNPRLLWAQYSRMKSGARHAYSMVIRDLLRNARCLVGCLRGEEAEKPFSARRCFYPGLMDSSVEVKLFYDKMAKVGNEVPSAQKAEASVSESTVKALKESAKIRKYNNLVKVLQIEEFADSMPSPVSVLDLGVGRGQDVYKWARQARKVAVKNYVGVDFAEEAVEEARRRHKTLVDRAGKAGQYPAVFYAGDLREEKTYEQLRAEGHTGFDIVSIQFVLNYLAGSEACMRAVFSQIHGLLRPGGRVLASAPNSDALGELFARGADQVDGAAMPEKGLTVGNSLFEVCFRDELWRHVDANDEDSLEEAFSRKWGCPYIFTMGGTVDGQEEYNVPWEVFEELVTGIGFKVLLDGRFPEVQDAYAQRSSYFNNVLKKDPEYGPLSEDEQELFSLYSAFVLERI